MRKPTFAFRRRLLRQTALTGVLGSLGTLGLLRAALAANPEQGMRSIRGTVTVDGKPAVPGQVVGAGQKVVTEGNSEAVFVIGKDAFLQRENSSFVFERDSGVVLLRYLSGKVLSVFGKGRKELATPTATIGIRGTACYIEAEAERTYFCLCYGKAEIRPGADPGKTELLHTWHHEHPVYIGNGSHMPVMSAGDIKNHSDAELVMLEKLVGRLPPFYGKTSSGY